MNKYSKNEQAVEYKVILAKTASWSKCSGRNGGRVEGQLDFGACINICQHCPPTSSQSSPRPLLCPYIVNREISHGQQVAVWRSHLDFAPDNCGQVAGGSSVSSGGKESTKPSRGSSSDNRPAQTNRPSVGFKCTTTPRAIVRNDVGALGFPGAAALARDTWGPETIDQKWSKDIFFRFSV